MKITSRFIGPLAFLVVTAMTYAQNSASMDAPTAPEQKTEKANQPATTEAASGTATAKPAPAFSGTDQKGNKHSLADHKGKVVVLEWTSSQCPVVQRHYKAGTMKSLSDKYKAQGVVWLAVDSSKDASVEKETKWAEEKKIDYPILIDADGTIGKAYAAKTTPHMFVIGKDGNLVYEGAIDDDPDGSKSDAKNFVDDAIQKALAGQRPEVSSTKPYGCGVKYAK